jgi:hypothetical protein
MAKTMHQIFIKLIKVIVSKATYFIVNSDEVSTNRHLVFILGVVCMFMSLFGLGVVCMFMSLPVFSLLIQDLVRFLAFFFFFLEIVIFRL